MNLYVVLTCFVRPLAVAVDSSELEPLKHLSELLPFFMFILGVALGAALMYVPMVLRQWKLKRRIGRLESERCAPK